MRESWSCSWICFLEVLVQIRRLLLSRQQRMSSLSTMVARQGRHRQRYDGRYRLVAGCIPYMLKETGEDGRHDLVDRLQVLMISTPKRSDLIFPKGGWEDDESMEEAACREGFEEAGVKGIISRTPLGEWIFKSKSKQNSCGLEGACKGSMFALRVMELLESWPEQITHGRRWVSVEDAYSLCRYEWMRDALDKLKDQLLFGNNSEPLPPPDLSDAPSLCRMMPALAEGAVALC